MAKGEPTRWLKLSLTFLTVRKFGGLVVGVVDGIYALVQKRQGKLKYLYGDLRKSSLFCLIQ